jgi:phosphopantetheinyl transferase (holo-ACP synthase)
VRSRVCSFLESASIAETRRTLAVVLARDFSPAEANSLRAGPVQTVAGFLALKRAVIAAARALSPDTELREREVVLRHDASGAPRLLRVPARLEKKVQRRRLFVSISHTRETAWGLVSYQEARRA